MIWNDATDVIFNGLRVVSVYCNGQPIWPTTAEPDAFTVFGFSAYQSGTGTEDLFGVNIYDSLNRKVYSTNGMHPFSSYEYSGGKFRVSAEGVAPFTYRVSASSRPWSAMRLHGYNMYSETDGSDMTAPGCLSTASGELYDSKVHTSQYATWETVDQMMSGTYNYATAQLGQKRFGVSGKCYRQSNSSISASMILFVPSQPEYAQYLASGVPLVSQEVTIPELYRTGITAGYFSTYADAMGYSSPLTEQSAFNMFNGVEYSGDVSLTVTASTAMSTATNTNDSCFMSVFPATLVSGAGRLSGGNSLVASSVAKATYNPGLGNTAMRASFGSAEASNYSYVGAYCRNPTAATYNHKLTVSATSLNYYASVAVP